MKSQTEIELKFLVPAAVRAQLAAEVARGLATRRTSLAALYLDTEDRRLARAGLAWRLRREGRRWVQTLKAGSAHALERFEHEVMRPGAHHDASVHAGSPAGDKLIALLQRAHADHVELGVRFQTEVRRTSRRVRTRGAVVEVAFDEGRIVATPLTQRIREIEFELISGSPAAMLDMVERWRARFGLLYDPHSKAERGDGLAQGSRFPLLRKASRPDYSRRATATQALGTVLDECLAQISRNAVGVAEGDPAQRIEHVHQLRVGIRRLRSALRSFSGWAPAPPSHLVEGLQALFATLGESRDSDVLDSGVVAELAKVGAPPLALPAGAVGTSPVQAIRAGETQQMLLGWIAWRVTLDDLPDAPEPAGKEAQSDPAQSEPDPTHAEALARSDARTFHRKAQRRLRRWHVRIVADWNAFDELDETALHALRKRIKRQRYAVEFFAPVLRRRHVQRYLGALTTIQERMGELNDLFVARARYEALVAADPAAWFALGWLTARIAALRVLAKPELERLAGEATPTG